MMKQTVTLQYRQYTIADLPQDDRELLDAAIESTATSYSPYSHFRVGAALRLVDGTVVTGSNQENIAYPSGLCAERTAMFAASAQHAGQAFEALAIVGRDSDGRLAAASPCGACRQVMVEYETRYRHKMRVLVYLSDEKILIFDSAALLLPFSFTM